MALRTPQQYIELSEEEMTYRDGGISFGRNWWNSRNSVSTTIDIALLCFGIWSLNGRSASKWIGSNTSKVAGAIAKIFNISISTRKRIMATIVGLSGIAGISVGSIVALGIDAADGYLGSVGLDGYCFG